ncbi:MAG: LacI family DNA-binding transcriptional regulator [Chloroflexota bacterium]
MTSMKDVAKAANVSVATVSRVLSNKPNVRQEVRDHVMRIARELGYRPNQIASSLRTRTSHVIGLVVSDIRNPFFTDIARAIEDVAHESGLQVFLCNSDEDPDKEAHYIATLLEQNAAGVILSPSPAAASNFDAIVNAKMPMVMIDRRIKGLTTDYVLSDNAAMAYELTKHIIAGGATRIAAVMGLAASFTGQERMAGYRRAMEEFDLEAIGVFVEPEEGEAERTVAAWLADDMPPNAILTGNVRLTLGAIRAIQQAGLTIPADVMIAGFDEVPWLAFVGPGITTISQPTYEIGRSAAEMLLARIENPDRPHRELILHGQLIVRESSSQRP